MRIYDLLKKDLTLELRGKKTLSLLLSLALLVSVVAGVAISSANLSFNLSARIFPGLVWLCFVFSATVSVGKSYDYELEHRALDGLILAGVAPWKIYLAKTIALSFITLIGQCLSSLFLSILLNTSLTSIIVPFLLISILIVLGYSALSVLLGAVASSTSLQHMLLPILLVPILFPLFFCGIELTSALIRDGSLSIESFWLSLLVGLDVLYMVLGLNLYEFVIKE